MEARYEEIRQKQDANYELLTIWNKVWLPLFLKNEFQGKLRRYRETEYESQFSALEDEIARLEASIQSQEPIQSQNELADSSGQGIDQHERLTLLKEALREARLMMEHDITRNYFFLNTFSSEYVAVALEKYILPLLYGLLGAVFFSVENPIEGAAGSYLSTGS